MTSCFLSEEALATFAVEELSALGFTVVKEAPCLGKSVDIAAKRDHRLYLFEAKLNDWRRALVQATYHLIVADYVFIVIPKKAYSKELYSLASAQGIGIIEVDPGTLIWRTSQRPRRSDRVWIPQRSQFERHMEELLHEC